MLTFVGAGLYDEKDITLKGMEAIKEADIVYAEFYTSRLMGTTIEKIEDAYKKKIILLEREDIEVDPDPLLREAKSSNVVLLTGGDPMIATTHIDLRLRAFDAGIKTTVVHAPSIFSAALGLCGLQNYRFGKSATIAPPYKDRPSEVPYDTIKMNSFNELHTLLYLDIPMTINRACEILLILEDKRGEGLFNERMIVGIARAGSKKPTIKADYIERIKEYDFGPPLHIMIATGKLHFMENEALLKFAGAPVEIMKE
ncbi:MAG: diphthine synthase [Halobacteriota archaeon]|nr:diphthine synthase [Halobacteriota archaeon]